MAPAKKSRNNQQTMTSTTASTSIRDQTRDPSHRRNLSTHGIENVTSTSPSESHHQRQQLDRMFDQPAGSQIDVEARPPGSLQGSPASLSTDPSKPGYDSQGAAYYICIVILVYALSLFVFLISLIKRRNRDKQMIQLAARNLGSSGTNGTGGTADGDRDICSVTSSSARHVTSSSSNQNEDRVSTVYSSEATSEGFGGRTWRQMCGVRVGGDGRSSGDSTLYRPLAVDSSEARLSTGAVNGSRSSSDSFLLPAPLSERLHNRAEVRPADINVVSERSAGDQQMLDNHHPLSYQNLTSLATAQRNGGAGFNHQSRAPVVGLAVEKRHERTLGGRLRYSQTCDSVWQRQDCDGTCGLNDSQHARRTSTVAAAAGDREQPRRPADLNGLRKQDISSQQQLRPAGIPHINGQKSTAAVPYHIVGLQPVSGLHPVQQIHASNCVAPRRPDNRVFSNPSKRRVSLHDDELITLVQVLPSSSDEEDDDEFNHIKNRSPTKRGVGEEERRGAVQVREARRGGSDRRRRSDVTRDPKCRWSIGSDGNIWILQMDTGHTTPSPTETCPSSRSPRSGSSSCIASQKKSFNNSDEPPKLHTISKSLDETPTSRHSSPNDSLLLNDDNILSCCLEEEEPWLLLQPLHHQRSNQELLHQPVKRPEQQSQNATFFQTLPRAAPRTSLQATVYNERPQILGVDPRSLNDIRNNESAGDKSNKEIHTLEEQSQPDERSMSTSVINPAGYLVDSCSDWRELDHSPAVLMREEERGKREVEDELEMKSGADRVTGADVANWLSDDAWFLDNNLPYYHKAATLSCGLEARAMDRSRRSDCSSMRDGHDTLGSRSQHLGGTSSGGVRCNSWRIDLCNRSPEEVLRLINVTSV